MLARGTRVEWSESNINMIKLALTLVSLVAAISAQETPETPLWFLETNLDGKFSDRSAACEGLFEQNQDVASFGPIFIPEDHDAKICIRVPVRDGSPITWRHDIGSRGPCSNQCCEFKPPLKNPPPPAPSQHGLRPMETAPTLLPLSTVQLCSEEKIWTLRKSASSWKMEHSSLDRDF